jgi:hypothetical protein
MANDKKFVFIYDSYSVTQSSPLKGVSGIGENK